MKFNATLLALFLGVFGLVPKSFAVDTLEVFALRIQFQKENPDNSLTTGDGTFDSDKKNKDAYSLDPPENRGTPLYWLKHFEFANNYFNAVSGGNLVVKARVFPDPSTGSSVYTLAKPIIDYNRTSKKKGEKTAEYDEARSRDYLTFIYDAIAAAAADSSEEGPFRIPVSKNPNVKRAYMIIHAGASRLVDGGSMGTKGADTPGDFMDIYIAGDDWQYLQADSARSKAAKPVIGLTSAGDTATTGIRIPGGAVDTLRSVMVVSETASQDGLNWGVNGIIVNQIAREIGLPNTYDVVKGISRLGYYDVMDFAGYNAGNGFLPSLPAAWERAYMGWSQVKEVRPVAGKPVTVDIAAAGTGKGTEIVKVPLSASEYLLIENRQRSWNKEGTIDVAVDRLTPNAESSVRTVPVDSLNLVFEDSVCVKGKCNENKKKAKGLIVGLDSYDAGLPASGIVVWRVNDWYLRETLPYGIANFWGGDTLRDHQFGVAMVEADGMLSIGKTFKNALGEDMYDYGSGTDLLPHKREAAEDSKQKFKAVTEIGPTGYANTMTSMGGYTGIKIKVDIPKDAREEKTANAFMGDSVVNYAALSLRVTISIDDGSIEGGKFPREIGLNSAVRGAVFVDDPENEGQKIIVVGAEDGTLQAFNALGDTLFVADTAIVQKSLSRDGAECEVPLYRVGASYGPLVGMASDGKDVYSLHTKKLVKTSFAGGFPVQQEIDIDSATAGPLVYDGKIMVADKTEGRSFVWTFSGASFDGKSAPIREIPAPVVDMAKCSRTDGAFAFAFVTAGNFVYAKGHGKNLGGASGEKWKIACTDLDRDGTDDVIVVGSRGTVTAYGQGKNELRALWTKSYKRGASGTSGLKDETSGIAIGDINGDGYPEVVFLGDNLVYALDRSGLPIAGFPVKISRGTPVAGFMSDPLLVDVTGDDIPEILVPSSDGLVYAYTGKGTEVKDQFPLAAGSFEYQDTLGTIYPMSIFVADAVPGKKSAGPELYALHRNSLSAFRLRKANGSAAESPAAWTLPAGGNERTGYFDASKLGDVEKAEEKDEISEFFVFPNPVRGGNAKARFEIGAAAKNATLELYDITGLCVFKQKMEEPAQGRNQFENLDLKQLGSDVYTARLKVKFKSGKTKQKLYRVGVIK
ncbi:FG-GAP-like repeat-containing protein [Fibrobacter sp. UBA2449]|uniref:FG-GAP-like repeat-containing protein n=1 Tax=Fibrobacter sp. UBA2449 TaxID=1946529 RepID=UPI0025C4E762|nr:FG-GAP-like repeat-containing protein [Fibrobacter sp. UBA2449]